jgi:hypothetical protein
VVKCNPQGHYNSLIQAASEVREQGAIDDHDTFLHAVRDLLRVHSSKQLLSYLIENVIVLFLILLTISDFL